MTYKEAMQIVVRLIDRNKRRAILKELQKEKENPQEVFDKAKDKNKRG